MDKISIVKKPLTNLTNKKIEVIRGITIHSYADMYNSGSGLTLFNKVKNQNIKKEDYGFHYIVSEDKVYQLADDNISLKNIEEKQTYISNALFNGDPKSACISILINVSKDEDYEKTEKLLTNLIVQLLRKYNLTAQDVWRGFDLSKDDKGPFHLLQKSLYSKYITQLEKYVPSTHASGGVNESIVDDFREEEIDDSKITFVSPFKELSTSSKLPIKECIYKIYDENIDNADSYVKNFEPWDKNRADIKNSDTSSNESTTIEGKEYPTGNTVSYTITQKQPNGSCDCVKASDHLEAIETSKQTMVEPIYPDIITPPGGEIQISNGTSESAVNSSSNTPLTVEEFERLQKRFSLDNFDNVSKLTIGRPVNTEDEFPVDEQIKKLEEHFPKVKVDKVTFNFDDDNHPGSEIGQAMAKNYAMCYDMVTEVSKRTEQRLVKLENNLATVMRNLFRMSSRVNINCVYYGGQSVYGKYKCIRCLHDNRVNDGAIVSLDQCLSCTRYEPILGQVYAILDETGSNVSQVVDDLQMAYMNLSDYSQLNNVSEYFTAPESANLSKNRTERPKKFVEEKWKDSEEEMKAKGIEDPNNIPEGYVNGFKMDWNPVQLETQSPNINSYDIEALVDGKQAINSDDNVIQGFDRELYVDSRENAVEYEQLEFNIDDYVFDGFGESSLSSSGGILGGLGATQVRNKIVAYAKEAVALCADGKAFYSNSLRMNHMDNAINGISYWDCSSLASAAYAAGGITGIGNTTATMYPYMLTKQGGEIIMLKDIDQALPGDLMWFKGGNKPATKEECQNVNYNDSSYDSGIHHVAIYIGDNQYAHASSETSVPNIKISTIGGYDHEWCFGRPKALIDLDKQASLGSGGIGAWNKDKQGISDALWEESAVADSNAEGFISNMNKYGYRDVLISVSQSNGFDPYFIAALCAVESNGNPMTGGNYPGIIQCSAGYATSDINGIKDNLNKGCESLLKDAEWLKKFGWVDTNVHLLASSHNCGRYGTTDALGHTNETRPSQSIPMCGSTINLSTCTIGEVSGMLEKYTKTYQSSWSSSEKKTYASKVCRAYNYLYAKNALGFQYDNNDSTLEGMPDIQKKFVKYNYSNRNSAIKYIVVHDTGNTGVGSNALAHYDYFNACNRGASADYFVDDKAIIQIVDSDKHYSWHCGDGEGAYGITNNNSIGIELCINSDGNYDKAYNNTVLLVKYLMKKYNISKDRVVRHYDASRKQCPGTMSKDNWALWNKFKSLL